MLGIGDELVGEPRRFLRRHALRGVDERELLRLGFGILRRARRARGRSGTRTARAASAPTRIRRWPSRTRPAHMPATPASSTTCAIGARAGDAQDQARVRHEPVVDAEHGRAQVAAAVRGRGADARRREPARGVAWPGVAPRATVVDAPCRALSSRPASLCMRRGPSLRTSAATSRVRASGTYGAGRGLAARGQLRAPDRGLRLGFAREAAEELGARGARLGLGADAIEERRALLLAASFRADSTWFERVQSRGASLRRARSAASMRAMTSGVSLRHDVERLHVLDDLRRPARAGDHRRHVRILEAPRERHLRQRAAEVGGDRREPLHHRDLLRIGQALGEPLVALDRAARARRDAVVVLAGQEARGERAPDRRAEADVARRGARIPSRRARGAAGCTAAAPSPACAGDGARRSATPP